MPPTHILASFSRFFGARQTSPKRAITISNIAGVKTPVLVL
jgi:hypothetical protein